MKFFLKYLSHIIFAGALAYYGLLAFVIESNPMVNKMIMILIAGFWILWIFAKSFVKVIGAIALLLAMAFACYYIMHADEIECKKSGKEWNEKLKTCEEKKTTVEKLKSAVTNMMKDALNKWKESKAKTDEENTKATKDEKENKNEDSKSSEDKTDEKSSIKEEVASVKEVIKDAIKETLKDTIAVEQELVEDETESESK